MVWVLLLYRVWWQWPGIDWVLLLYRVEWQWTGMVWAYGHKCIMLLYRLGWQRPRITSVSCCYTGWGGKGMGSSLSHGVIQAGVARA